MSDKTAPAQAAAPKKREHPVSAYLLRRLKAAEEEALSANARLAGALDAVEQITGIAERLKAIAQKQEAEIAALKMAGSIKDATLAVAGVVPAKPARKK